MSIQGCISAFIMLELVVTATRLATAGQHPAVVVTSSQRRRVVALVRANAPVTLQKLAGVRVLTGHQHIVVVLALLNVLLLALLSLIGNSSVVLVLVSVAQVGVALFLLNGVHHARRLVATHPDHGDAVEVGW